jgi:hypothetical protein
MSLNMPSHTANVSGVASGRVAGATAQDGIHNDGRY